MHSPRLKFYLSQGLAAFCRRRGKSLSLFPFLCRVKISIWSLAFPQQNGGEKWKRGENFSRRKWGEKEIFLLFFPYTRNLQIGFSRFSLVSSSSRLTMVTQTWFIRLIVCYPAPPSRHHPNQLDIHSRVIKKATLGKKWMQMKLWVMGSNERKGKAWRNYTSAMKL